MTEYREAMEGGFELDRIKLEEMSEFYRVEIEIRLPKSTRKTFVEASDELETLTTRLLAEYLKALDKEGYDVRINEWSKAVGKI
jgi:hypothetical protein